jgi:hypothetical protein
MSLPPTMSPRVSRAVGDLVAGLSVRSQDHLTSFASIGSPLWNLAFGWILKVKVVPSCDKVQEAARLGTSLPAASTAISVA